MATRKGCRYGPGKRAGDNVLARHEDVFAGNHRMARQVAGMRRLSNLPAVCERVIDVLAARDADDL